MLFPATIGLFVAPSVASAIRKQNFARFHECDVMSPKRISQLFFTCTRVLRWICYAIDLGILVMWQESFQRICFAWRPQQSCGCRTEEVWFQLQKQVQGSEHENVGIEVFYSRIYNRYLGLLRQYSSCKVKSQPKESREIATECERGGWLGKRGSVGTSTTGRRCEVGLQVGKLKLQNCRLSFSTRGVTV